MGNYITSTKNNHSYLYFNLEHLQLLFESNVWIRFVTNCSDNIQWIFPSIIGDRHNISNDQSRTSADPCQTMNQNTTVLQTGFMNKIIRFRNVRLYKIFVRIVWKYSNYELKSTFHFQKQTWSKNTHKSSFFVQRFGIVVTRENMSNLQNSRENQSIYKIKLNAIMVTSNKNINFRIKPDISATVLHLWHL